MVDELVLVDDLSADAFDADDLLFSELAVPPERDVAAPAALEVDPVAVSFALLDVEAAVAPVAVSFAPLVVLLEVDVELDFEPDELPDLELDPDPLLLADPDPELEPLPLPLPDPELSLDPEPLDFESGFMVDVSTATAISYVMASVSSVAFFPITAK